MQMTPKQLQLMQTIVTANEDGSFTDLDQILERLTYDTTKQSLQFSLRALIKKGVIVKKARENRRGRSRVILAPTEVGYNIMTA